MQIDEVKADESDPRVVTLEEIMKLSMEGRWNDVTIICKDGKIQSNSLLLASIFPVIREIFRYFENEEDIFISMPDISLNEIGLFLRAVYQKDSIMKVNVGTFNLLGLKMQHFEAANSAKLVQLVDADEVNIYNVESFNDHDDAYDNAESYNDHDHDYAAESKLEPRLATVTAIVKINFAKSQEEKDNKSEWTHCICNVCGRFVEFSEHSPDITNKRTKTTEEMKIYQCSGCSTKNVPCEVCGKEFYAGHLEGHMRIHQDQDTEDGVIPPHLDENKRKCHGECGNSECRKIFSRSYSLMRHIEEKKSGPKTCHICGKIVLQMNMHIKRHHDSSRSKCSTCGKVMLIEMLEDHEKSCEKYVCNTCGKSFSSKKAHDYHRDTWHEVLKAEHKCDQCGKLFVRKERLKAHMRSHEEKTPCPECGLIVRDLNYHMAHVHTPDDQKPHQCQDCGKGFLIKKRLEIHRMNMHLKLRPYNCRYGCDIAYNDTSNRNQHEKKTHGKLFTTEKEEKMKLLNGICQT